MGAALQFHTCLFAIRDRSPFCDPNLLVSAAVGVRRISPEAGKKARGRDHSTRSKRPAAAH